MIKIHNYELLQHFTYPEPISANSVSCNSVYFVYIYFSHFFLPCTHPILFSMKAHSIDFFVFFFSTSLICFCSCFYILFKHIINHAKFLQLNLIHSSVYIQQACAFICTFSSPCSVFVCFPNCAYFTQMLFYNTSQ